MVARTNCVVLGLAILGVGIFLASLALVALATALVTLSAVHLGEARRICRRERNRAPVCSVPGDLPRALMLAVGAAGFAGVTVALGSGDSQVGLSIVAWLLSIGALIGLGLALDRMTVRDALAATWSLFSASNRAEVAWVMVIASVALVLRFYDLEEIPAFFHEDEGEMARIALGIVNGDRIPYFRTASDWGPTYPFNYLQALAIWLFGSSTAGARTVSAVAGVLCVPVVYAIGRIGWGPVAGVMAAWLLAVSHLHIHYSRLAHGFMVATLLAATTVLFLALAARQAERFSGQAVSGGDSSPRGTGTGFWTFMIAAGALAGISQHFYHSTRIVPMILGVLLMVMVAKHRVGRWHLESLAFAFLVAYVPLGVTYLERPSDFFVGLSEISAVRGWYARELFGPEASLPAALPALMAEQIRRTLRLFIRQSDLSGYYPGGGPAFDGVTVGLTWIGLGVALSRPRRFHEAALLVWLGFGLIFGSALTLRGESGHRILIMTPAVFLLGGVGLARGWSVLHSTPRSRADWLAPLAGTVLVLWLMAANVVTYFVEHAPRVEQAESTYMAREMRARGREYRYYFLTVPHFEPNHPSIRYLAGGLEAENVKSPDELKMPPTDGKGILVLALPHRRDDLRVIAGRLGGGEERDVVAPDGRLLYHTYEVPPNR